MGATQSDLAIGGGISDSTAKKSHQMMGHHRSSTPDMAASSFGGSSSCTNLAGMAVEKSISNTNANSATTRLSASSLTCASSSKPPRSSSSSIAIPISSSKTNSGSGNGSNGAHAGAEQQMVGDLYLSRQLSFVDKTGISEHDVESLDLQTVEWEGYIEKKGHLVRNWKTRFFTLEGNCLSYYECKEDARRRKHLKGRVTITEVKFDNRVKHAHGNDFVFETKEGKHFHVSAPTKLDRYAWVQTMEAGIDYAAMSLTNRPLYDGVHLWRKQHSAKLLADVVYSVYQSVMTDNPSRILELLSFFNKDVVFSSYYPTKAPFHGDFFGREGVLHFVSSMHENVELLNFCVKEIKESTDGKSVVIHGSETIKSKSNGVVLEQPWVHHIRYGPYGGILRLKIDINPKLTNQHGINNCGTWGSFAVTSTYAAPLAAAARCTRSLSISLQDFTVYHVIGKGGFGTVVNAKKKSDGCIYALKILEKGKMTKYDIESSFTEMRVAQNIHHPFVAGLRLAFQSRSKLFLGMNYYAGGDLFHHMSKGATCRIAPPRARFYSAELILAIHHLHQHDILYRDIKPENVMIDHDGHIALVDFGLAKLHVSNYKGAKTMAGSPQYTAPELLLPKGKRSYGKAADWWSLGILLYEMSVGRSPFFDSNIEKMYQKIQKEAVGFPSRPALSQELKDLLLGLLRKDPRERYGNDIGDLLEHSFFKGIDWDLLLKKKITAPWKPKLRSALDIGYVDAEFTDLDVNQEVSSPSERESSKHKNFLNSTFERFVGKDKKKSKSTINSSGVGKSIGNGKDVANINGQDPVFKDFTYFCDDPEKLVEFNTLVGELHVKDKEKQREEEEEARKLKELEQLGLEDKLQHKQPSCEKQQETVDIPIGTPLASFMANGGQLDYISSPLNSTNLSEITAAARNYEASCIFSSEEDVDSGSDKDDNKEKMSNSHAIKEFVSEGLTQEDIELNYSDNSRTNKNSNGSQLNQVGNEVAANAC